MSYNSKMNINEFYGNVELPSEIADSYAANSDEEGQDSESKYGSGHIDEEGHSEINLDSSLQDTFLEKIRIPKKQDPLANSSQQPKISISKPEIIKYALPKQQMRETIQIANCSLHPTILTIKSPFRIVHATSASEGAEGKEIYSLSAWEKREITFLLVKDEDQFGDIFESIVCEAKFKDKKISHFHKNYRIEVTVHYVAPKLKLMYEGCSQSLIAFANKIAICEIARNKFGEYQLQLSFEQVERLQCSLETVGEVEIFPKELVFYKGESRKLNIRKEASGIGKKSAVVIRAKDGSAAFVFGVKIV